MATVIGKDSSFVKQTTCRNCASILQYTQSEVQKRISQDYTGHKDVDYYIPCPVCMKECFVKGY